MRESVKVLGVVTAGQKNSRVLMERVNDGLKVTMLFLNAEVPAKDAVMSVEFDKTRSATEREIRVVGLHNAGKGAHTAKKATLNEDSGNLGPAAHAESPLPPPVPPTETVQPVSGDVIDPLAGGVESVTESVGSGGFPPIPDMAVQPDSVGAVAPGLAETKPPEDIL